MFVPAELGVVTRALLGVVSDGTGEPGLARRICDVFVDGLDIDGAALSVLTASVSRQTLWASDPTAQRLEDLQFALNEGACMDAATTGHPVIVGDLATSAETRRWPLFAAEVAERTPVAALFALPLRFGAVILGVLDLYRTTPGDLGAEQLRDALAGADTAALMLLGTRTDPDGYSADGTGPFEGAPAYRAEIHQATGMVLAQLNISATDALARLRAHAFTHDQLLVDSARAVIDRQLVFTPDMT